MLTGPGADAQEHSAEALLDLSSPVPHLATPRPHLVSMGTEEVKAGLKDHDADLLRESKQKETTSPVGC